MFSDLDSMYTWSTDGSNAIRLVNYTAVINYNLTMILCYLSIQGLWNSLGYRIMNNHLKILTSVKSKKIVFRIEMPKIQCCRQTLGQSTLIITFLHNVLKI